MRKKLLFLFACLATLSATAQSYYRNISETIPGNGGSLYDTLNVTNLNQSALTAAFGLDTVSIDNLQYNNDQDLIISLIAPDGTIIHLSDNLGGGGSNFTGTYFDMNVTNFVNDASAPFTGEMRPEMWLGLVNNGQIGNGKWILHILNTNGSNNTGTLLQWGLHFSTTPAPPTFFNSSTLPIVVFNTNDVVIPFASDVKVYGKMGIINNGPGQLNYVTNAFNDYNGYISIKVRGNSTTTFPTPSYTVETEDSLHNNNNVSILGLPADNDWVFYAPWDDKSLIRDVLTYQLSNDMGDYASRTRLCQLMLNGDYRGIYVLEEKIKQGADRVNIHKLTAADTTGNKITGGYIFEVDRAEEPGYDSWFSVFPPCAGSQDQVAFAYVDPKPGDINAPQENYIATYVDSFETALMSGNIYDTVNGYRKYIQVPTFIDQSLLQEIGHNVDGYRLSSFLYKDKNGKLCAGPIWDFNEAYGNSNYYNGQAYNTFEWDLPCPMSDGNLNPFWWLKFLTDTNYYKSLQCRYTQLRGTSQAFDTAHLDHVVDSLVTILQVPQQQHYERWPILGVYTWPNYYVGNTWPDEINYLKSWLGSRVQWMDSSLISTNCTVPVDTTTDTTHTTVVPNIKTSNVQIYPNPTSDELSITSDVIINNISIYNIAGQKIYGIDVNSMNYKINLRQYGISSGVYNIILSTSSGSVTKKIVLTE